MKQLFNNDWFFHREPLETTIDTFFNTKDWEPVDIPHDWMIYDSKDLFHCTYTWFRPSVHTV